MHGNHNECAPWRRACIDRRDGSRSPHKAKATTHRGDIVKSCGSAMVPIGEQHFRRAMAEYVAHDDAERLHQGCGNMLLRPASPSQPAFMIAAKTSGSVTPSDPISKTRAFASSPRVRRMSWQSAAAISAASPATALSPASIFGSSPAGQASMRTALLHEYPVGVGSRVVGRLWP